MSFTAVAFPWDRSAILASAPKKSGVYAIWNKQKWIYVGESHDIQRRLLEHFDTAGTCIQRGNPTVWGYELFQAEQSRVQRKSALVLELQPACNQATG